MKVCARRKTSGIPAGFPKGLSPDRQAASGTDLTARPRRESKAVGRRKAQGPSTDGSKYSLNEYLSVVAAHRASPLVFARRILCESPRGHMDRIPESAEHPSHECLWPTPVGERRQGPGRGACVWRMLWPAYMPSGGMYAGRGGPERTVWSAGRSRAGRRRGVPVRSAGDAPGARVLSLVALTAHP